MNLLCGHSELFSGIWPTSGSMRSGAAFERQPWAPAIPGSGSSSSRGLLLTPRASPGAAATENGYLLAGRDRKGALLPTPTANLADNGGSQAPAKRIEGGHMVTLADALEHLLPTPKARDEKGRADRVGQGGPGLPDVLLPTPRASDADKGGPNQRGSSGDWMLPSAVHHLTERTSGSTPPPSRGTPRSPDNDPQLLLWPAGEDGDAAGTQP